MLRTPVRREGQIFVTGSHSQLCHVTPPPLPHASVFTDVQAVPARFTDGETEALPTVGESCFLS